MLLLSITLNYFIHVASLFLHVWAAIAMYSFYFFCCKDTKHVTVVHTTNYEIGVNIYL